MRYKKFKES